MSDIDKKQTVRDCFIKFLENPDLYSDKLIAKLSNFKDSWVSERDKLNQRIWRNSVLFYAGQHHIRDTLSTSNTYRVRLRENHINNIISRILSIITQNMPITRVFPASDASHDVDDAKNTEHYLKYFWRQKKLEQQIQKFIKYTLLFGNAFMYSPWNPDLGGKMQMSMPDDQGGEKTISEYRGDIEVFVDDPFKIAVRPGIEDYKDHYDIIRSVPVSRAMLESKYGEVKADPAVSLNYQTGDYRVDDDTVVMNCYYHKPTPWFEEGMYVAWCGNRLLKARRATDAESELPIVYLGFDKVPMKFWHLSNVEQIMDLQEQLNRAASMIIEARNLIARPRVLASNQAKVSSQSVTDRPGEIIKYDMTGGAPQFIVPPFNFNELAAHKSDVRNAMGMVSGMTLASRGEIPSAVTTALALQLTLEMDRSQFAPFIKNFHQSVLDLSNNILKQAADNIDEQDPRVVRIEGKLNETRTFHGGMVPSPLDIYLEDTNPLGWTASGRIEKTVELVKSGIVKDPNKALEMLHLSNPDPAFEAQNINRQSQKKEIQLLEKGQFVEVGPADNDSIHVDEIDMVIAAFEFRDKPDIVKQAYLAHRQAHLDRINMMSQAQQQPEQQQSMKQGPGLESAVGGLQSPDEGQTLNQLLTSARGG